LAFDVNKLPSEEQVVELFQQWKEHHQKFYMHPEEAALRLENFKRNLKYIVERNAMRNSPLRHRLGLNRFADMSNEEFKNKFISKVKKPISKRRLVKSESCENTPNSFDWRKKGAVTGVKDQGNCGKLLCFIYTIKSFVIYIVLRSSMYEWLHILLIL
jgi:C1A family cysteine protease